jgi:hypothetical protein
MANGKDYRRKKGDRQKLDGADQQGQRGQRYPFCQKVVRHPSRTCTPEEKHGCFSRPSGAITRGESYNASA